MATVTRSQDSEGTPQHRSGVPSALTWVAVLALLGVVALGIAVMGGQQAAHTPQVSDAISGG